MRRWWFLFTIQGSFPLIVRGWELWMADICSATGTSRMPGQGCKQTIDARSNLQWHRTLELFFKQIEKQTLENTIWIRNLKKWKIIIFQNRMNNWIESENWCDFNLRFFISLQFSPRKFFVWLKPAGMAQITWRSLATHETGHRFHSHHF